LENSSTLVLLENQKFVARFYHIYSLYAKKGKVRMKFFPHSHECSLGQSPIFGAVDLGISANKQRNTASI